MKAVQGSARNARCRDGNLQHEEEQGRNRVKKKSWCSSAHQELLLKPRGVPQEGLSVLLPHGLGPLLLLRERISRAQPKDQARHWLYSVF